MKFLYKLSRLIFLIVLITGSSSCGSSETTSDDILRLGGISSTGNKDESAGDRKDDSQDAKIPLFPDQVCEDQLDLSPRTYRRVPVLLSQECGQGLQVNSCIFELKFEGPLKIVATYGGHSIDTPSVATARYKACNQKISTTFHSGSFWVLSEDQKTITDELLNVVFKIVR